MKKTLLLLLLPIIVFSSYTEFTDTEGNTIPYINVTYGGNTIQMLNPAELPAGDTLIISAMGFEDTIIFLERDSTVIVLQYRSIESDTVFVKADKPLLKQQSAHPVWKSESTMRTMSPFLSLRQYARDIVYSIRNSSSEQVTLTIDGNPLINPSSGIISLNLIPVTGFKNISVIQDEIISTAGNAVFSGIIDFSADRGSGFDLTGQFSTRDRFCGVSYNRNNVRAAFEYFDYDNIILPDNEILPNSYSSGYRMMAGNNNMLILFSTAKSGSPGLEGRRFASAFYEESMTHMHFSDSINKIELSYNFTGNAYHYFNDELAEITDSRQHSWNSSLQASYISDIGSMNLSLSNDAASGSNIETGIRNNAGLLYETSIGNNQFSANISLPLMPGFLYRYIMAGNYVYRDMGLKFSGRKPTFNELYWTGDVFATGNDSLKNEYMLALFYNDMREWGQWIFALNAGVDIYWDMISWQDIDAYYMPVNNRRVINPYISTALSFEQGIWDIYAYACISPAIDDHIDSYMAFVQDIQDGSAAHISNYYSFMLYRPLWNSGINIALTWRNISLRSNMAYTGVRFSNEENTKYFEPYMLINNTGIAYTYRYCRIELYIDNLLNTRFNDVRGYTNEGRTFNISITLEDL